MEQPARTSVSINQLTLPLERDSFMECRCRSGGHDLGLSRVPDGPFP
jgi:hypothetical protein